MQTTFAVWLRVSLLQDLCISAILTPDFFFFSGKERYMGAQESETSKTFLGVGWGCYSLCLRGPSFCNGTSLLCSSLLRFAFASLNTFPFHPPTLKGEAISLEK